MGRLLLYSVVESDTWLCPRCPEIEARNPVEVCREEFPEVFGGIDLDEVACGHCGGT